MKFFGEWQTWEKLVFILACAIVVTVLAGCIKLGYTHWRLRKYTDIAEKERKEQALQAQMSMMSQNRRPVGTQASDEVPFGIRAIESGMEVDGVWISRNNTPEPVSRNASAGSSIWDHVPRVQQKADLEKQMHVHERSISGSTIGSARPASSSLDLALPTEKLPGSKLSRESSPEPRIAKLPRSHYPPCSYARFSNTPYIHRPPSSLSTLEGLEAIHKASTHLNLDGSTGSSGSSNDSGHSGNDAEPISASAPKLLNNQGVPRPRPRHKSSSELDLMDSHRISQAAETGQFTPRVRKPSQSGDLSNMSLPVSTNAQHEQVDYFTNRQRLPPTPPDSGSGSPTDPFAAPKIDALPAAVRRSSLPNVTPFAQFCQTAPPSPQADGRRSPSISGLRLTTHNRSSSDGASIYMSAPASPIESTPTVAPVTSPPVLAHPHPRRTSFEKRESQVIRGHGTGFEIMKPGTFNAPSAAEHPMERQRAAPPISFSNASRPRSSSADSRRKLQKKHRPSMSSEMGIESGRKSRNSIL